ncbi:NAD(P)-dependent oxidoreductase [Patescibacteria group bacterium]|nr:NAD(P)-dependent oxidoreductase [Patescibacteria group bacterium]MBU4353402.1 NAD(P)-dependent oxidoreductase [Patescibacteria group bacterium]MBU4477218.1 NAD(P)-dependent oxidoreductase [Patescibacteria group bacterium]MCG2699179.1 NAD(P)-dependent oxidoreductase [Candidatus Parcubacteria bacterium]
MKKILITGGAGFIGYHLAKHLLNQEYEIVIADNFFRSERDADLENLLKQPNVKLVTADLTIPASWENIGNGYDYVYHLVGINGTKLFYEIPHEVLRIGITTTLNVLDWFKTKNNKPGAKILYTSSNEAYAGALEAFGKLPIPTPENVPLIIADPYNPRWSYAGQKLISELLFIHYSKAYNFRMSIVRPHNFYGPREGYMHVIPEVIERIKQKTDPFPIFGADDTRSFCYIDDAILAIQGVMESKKTDEGTYHIGTHEETVIMDLVETMFNLMDWRPKNLEIKKSPLGSVKRRLADVSKIKMDIGWEAKTNIKEGLEKTIAWYNSRK